MFSGHVKDLDKDNGTSYIEFHFLTNSFSLSVQLKIYSIHSDKNLITMILLRKEIYQFSLAVSSIRSKDDIHLSFRT